MASFGTHEKGSVNVELNIVPFIDLMSCLTAFLLVTAVWVNVANLRNQPAGRARDQVDTPEHPKIAILLDADSIRISATPSGQGLQLAANDWDKLAAGGDPKSQVCGWLKDRYGLSWQVVPKKMVEWFGDPNEKSERVMTALLRMGKLDIAALERAAQA